MLSWDDFRYVKAIADARSLAGAAEALKVNHSTVFRRLAQVEQRLGTRLFERSRSGYALTPCGEEMVHLAERMDDDIVAFEREVTGHDLRPSGELRITTNDTILVHLLTDILAAFRRAYPEIALDVMVANEPLNLSKRDADVALRATHRPPENLVGRRVAGIAWAPYGPKELAGRFNPAADARHYDWLGFGDNLSGIKAARWLSEHAGDQRIVYKANTILGLAQAATSGIGLAMLPCFIGEATAGVVRLAPPDPALEIGLWLLTHADLRQTARVRAFMDFAATEITRHSKTIEGLT